MDLHRRQDLRSLAFQREAVRVLVEHPDRALRAHWEEVAGPESKPLRDEWRRIVEEKLWHLAVEDSNRGQQLRQASPLDFVLDERVRDAIMRRYRRT